jgi:hypothetical protein
MSGKMDKAAPSWRRSFEMVNDAEVITPSGD